MSEEEIAPADEVDDEATAGQASAEPMSAETRYGAIVAHSLGDVVLHPGVEQYLDAWKQQDGLHYGAPTHQYAACRISTVARPQSACRRST